MVIKENTARHRIFCLMGKSGTGKDTLYKKLLSDGALPFERLVPCTTRPIRAGEENGREYHFYSVEEFQAMEAAGRVIESRCYETIHGPWYYFTADDGQIDLTGRSTLLIGTLESYQALRDYYEQRFGAGCVVPIYVEVEDGERLQRALDRTANAPNPCQNIARCAVASSPTARTSPRSASPRQASQGASRTMTWSGASRRSKNICWR